LIKQVCFFVPVALLIILYKQPMDCDTQLREYLGECSENCPLEMFGGAVVLGKCQRGFLEVISMEIIKEKCLQGYYGVNGMSHTEIDSF